MKKFISVFLCLALVITSMFMLSTVSFAEPAAESDFSYTELDDGTVSVTAYNGSLLDIEIPSTINGKTVSKIADRLFYNKTAIKSVVIPVGVTSIGEYAFYSCRALESVTIPYTVKSIGQWCFYNDVSLTAVFVPEGVEVIEYRSFYGCTALADITLPASLNTIGQYAFYRCPAKMVVHTPTGSYAEEWAESQGYTTEDTTFYSLSVDKLRAQVKMTKDPSTESGVQDAFSLRIQSVIPAEDWDRFVGNTTDKGSETSSVIESMGIVAYRGNGAFDEATAKSVAAGGTADDYASATTTYLQRDSNTSDAYFGAIIKLSHSTAVNDIVYMGFVNYRDEKGQLQTSFYEASYTAAIATQYNSIVSRYLATM